MPASFTYDVIMNADLAESPGENIRRTEMEDGFIKQSRIRSKSLYTYNIRYLMSSANYASFLTWYDTTVNHGASFFDFANPITASTEQGRIVGGRWESRPLTTVQNYYVVSMSIEVYK